MTGVMPEKPLDFDYQSTTPCSQMVLDAMSPYWQDLWGNPSNRQNRSGLYASAAISNAREKLASLIGIKPEKLIFTSGATEANNLALLGYARAKAIEVGKPGHLITLSTEHYAVLDPLKQLQREGFRVTKLSPNLDGIISLDRLENAFEDDTFMVSIMFANNEIGVIQPIEKISSLCKKRGIIMHSDIAQGFGYIPIDFNSLGIDFLSISGHKIYGPKGIGALIINEDLPIQPLQWGGGQQNGIRPGTMPVPLIIGLAKAAEIAISQLDEQFFRSQDLRNQLWDGLQKSNQGLKINGSMIARLPHNLNFTVLNVSGGRLHKLLKPFISCSSGSACSNGSPSHVLQSIGLSLKEAEASLRLSLGRDTNIEDIKEAIYCISQVISQLREGSTC